MSPARIASRLLLCFSVLSCLSFHSALALRSGPAAEPSLSRFRTDFALRGGSAVLEVSPWAKVTSFIAKVLPCASAARKPDLSKWDQFKAIVKKRCFDRFDINKSGALEMQEIEAAASKLLEYFATNLFSKLKSVEMAAPLVMMAFDTDKNNTITFEELLAVMVRRLGFETEEEIAVFVNDNFSVEDLHSEEEALMEFFA